MDWTHCDSDECYFYYSFDSITTTNDPAGLFDMLNQDNSGNVSIECVSSAPTSLWDHSVEHCVIFVETRVLMQVDGEKWYHENPLLVIPLKIHERRCQVDDDCVKTFIPHLGAIHVESISQGRSVIVQDFCHINILEFLKPRKHKV